LKESERFDKPVTSVNSARRIDLTRVSPATVRRRFVDLHQPPRGTAECRSAVTSRRPQSNIKDQKVDLVALRPEARSVTSPSAESASLLKRPPGPSMESFEDNTRRIE